MPLWKADSRPLALTAKLKKNKMMITRTAEVGWGWGEKSEIDFKLKDLDVWKTVWAEKKYPKQKQRIHSVASTNVGEFLRGLQENNSNSLKTH